MAGGSACLAVTCPSTVFVSVMPLSEVKRPRGRPCSSWTGSGTWPSANEHRPADAARWSTQDCKYWKSRAETATQGCIWRGVGGVEPPRENFWPPLLLLKKRKGGSTLTPPSIPHTQILTLYYSVYCILQCTVHWQCVHSRRLQWPKLRPPLMKFDKYSPAATDDQGSVLIVSS